MHTLATSVLSQRRDLITARTQARQIASLLRFNAQDQYAVAAGVFAVAERAFALLERVELCFGLEAHALHVFARAIENDTTLDAPVLRLVRPLPNEALGIPCEDLAFVVSQLPSLRKSSAFEEVTRMNQETLSLLHALQRCERELAELQRAAHSSHAA